MDAQWGKPGRGLFALGEYPWQCATAAKNTIQGIQGVRAYNIRMKSPTSWLYAVEPAFRFDLADPNTNVTTTVSPHHRGAVSTVEPGPRFGWVRASSFQGDVTPSISGVRSALTVNF